MEKTTGAQSSAWFVFVINNCLSMGGRDKGSGRDGGMDKWGDGWMSEWMDR